jgi:hypothetical protein
MRESEREILGPTQVGNSEDSEFPQINATFKSMNQGAQTDQGGYIPKECIP